MTSPFTQHSKFYTLDAEQQQADQVVNISEWSIGGDFNPYEQGTRAKFEVFCPDSDSLSSFLIPWHRYLYKKSFERSNGFIHHSQFWVEIAAYHLGRTIGVEVPPAFVACRKLPDEEELEYACLIEWFYGYPESDFTSVQQGGDFMSLYCSLYYGGMHYDREKGRDHNFETISLIMQDIVVSDWLEDWTKIILFDTLIGNTDRHQENWEILNYANGFVDGKSLSPAFDNGTALGFEILDDKIANKMNSIDSFISKGTHHMKWKLEDEKQVKHLDLLLKLVDSFPEAKEQFSSLLTKDVEPAYEKIRSFTKFEIKNPVYRLSEERAEFMIALIKARHKKAREILGI